MRLQSGLCTIAFCLALSAHAGTSYEAYRPAPVEPDAAPANELAFHLGVPVDSPSVSLAGSASLQATGRAGLATGFAYTRWLSPAFGIEADALFALRGYTLSSPSSPNSLSIHRGTIELPLLARWSPLPYLAFGFGPMLDVGVGNVVVDETLNGAAQPTQAGSYATTGLRRVEYSLVASVQGALPLSPGANVLLDVRYILGLANEYSAPTSPDDTLYEREVEVLAGISFSF